MFSWIIEKLFTVIAVIVTYTFSGITILLGFYVTFFVAVGMVLAAPFYYVAGLFRRNI